MITEYLMHRFVWPDIWYSGRQTFWKSLKGKRFHVGMWTGPDHDMLCLKRCYTNGEAKIYKSPGGRTITGALINAIYKISVLDQIELP